MIVSWSDFQRSNFSMHLRSKGYHIFSLCVDPKTVEAAPLKFWVTEISSAKFLARIYLWKLLILSIQTPLPQSSGYIHTEVDLSLENTLLMVKIEDPTKKGKCWLDDQGPSQFTSFGNLVGNWAGKLTRRNIDWSGVIKCWSGTKKVSFRMTEVGVLIT